MKRTMQKKTEELLKKFERDHEVYVSATEELAAWTVYARIPRSHAPGTHHLHVGRKYLSGPNEHGTVRILRDPVSGDAYSTESWGPMALIDDFVEKALDHILEEKNAMDHGKEAACGPSCI
jgi:hypothetical protein